MLESRQLFSFKNGLKFVKPDSLTETVISGMTLLQRACSEGLPGNFPDYGVYISSSNRAKPYNNFHKV